MKVLVTGSTGLVGNSVKHYLENHGVKVIQAGRTLNESIFFDPHCESRSRAETWPACDATIHIAAANEIECRENPSRALVTNVFGTQLALEKSAAAGTPSFVYVSTFHVYGNATGIIDEGLQPEPTDAYGLTHLFAEQVVAAFSRKQSTQTTVLRPSNLFGMPTSIGNFQRWSLVPYGFCRDAVNAKEITLLTPGLQQRNFVHMAVLAGEILNSARQASTERVLNVAGADTLSIKQFADLVSRRAKVVLGVDVQIIAPSTANAPPTMTFCSKFQVASANPAVALTAFVDQLLIALQDKLQ